MQSQPPQPSRKGPELSKMSPELPELPDRRTITVYRSASDIETLAVGAELDGGELLPGFHCPMFDLFVNP